MLLITTKNILENYVQPVIVRYVTVLRGALHAIINSADSHTTKTKKNCIYNVNSQTEIKNTDDYKKVPYNLKIFDHSA